MNKLLIYGVASPYAWDLVESCWRLQRTPICLDNIGGANPHLPEHTRLDTAPLAAELLNIGCIIGLASPAGRYHAALAAYQADITTYTCLVDASAVVARTAKLSHGVYVNAGVVIAANTRIGCHVNVNRSASIGHDVTLESFVSIGPGAILAGHVQVHKGAFIAAGATILPKITIGAGATVGAGAVVTKSVLPGETVVGNPARRLGELKQTLPDFICPVCQEKHAAGTD